MAVRAIQPQTARRSRRRPVSVGARRDPPPRRGRCRGGPARLAGGRARARLPTRSPRSMQPGYAGSRLDQVTVHDERRQGDPDRASPRAALAARNGADRRAADGRRDREAPGLGGLARRSHRAQDVPRRHPDRRAARPLARGARRQAPSRSRSTLRCGSSCSATQAGRALFGFRHRARPSRSASSRAARIEPGPSGELGATPVGTAVGAAARELVPGARAGADGRRAVADRAAGCERCDHGHVLATELEGDRRRARR